MNTLPRVSPKEDEGAEGSAFQCALETGRAKSLHRTQQGASFTSSQKSTKGLVDFLFATNLTLGTLPADHRQYWT